MIISDRGTFFCNVQFEKVFKKYGIVHRVVIPYHQQISDQGEVVNKEMDFREYNSVP